MIGSSVLRADARGKVTGTAPYAGDLVQRDMLAMKIMFARRPHARVLNMDIQRAKAHPGVVDIFTARDVPVNEYGIDTRDQPVLVGPGSQKPGAGVARFVGDQLAFVIAESEPAAATGRDLISVDWEELHVIVDPREGIKPDAPRLFPDHDTNVFAKLRVRKGDVETAWPRCAAVVEAEYRTPFQEHAYLEPEAGTWGTWTNRVV